MSTFTSGNILLPKTADMKKWAVVACDQYTSEPEYWNETAKLTEDAPSALNLILPELYLEADDVEQRIRKIHSVMNNYITDGIFEEYKDSMIYIERTQFDGAVRAGIVGCIDLEAYDYRKGSDSPVRATEATVIERIPPRIKVRKSAALELPHIMILVDDAEKTVIEPLEAIKDKLEKVYDFELMQKGGSIKGWLLGKNEQSGIEAALSELSSQKNFDAKYGLSGKKPLVFAMGDGNHSFAVARE